MSGEVSAAIEKLETELAADLDAFREAERTVYGKKIAINSLCELLGEPPRYPVGGEPGADGAAARRAKTPDPKGTPATMTIRSDTFYGKRQQTAIREYLEMRKAAGQGAATPREIFDALTAGGFRYEAKDETTALIGLRALLRKRTAFFHKLPNGTYGLTSWYPDAKKPKATSTSHLKDDDDDEDTSEAALNDEDAA